MEIVINLITTAQSFLYSRPLHSDVATSLALLIAAALVLTHCTGIRDKFLFIHRKLDAGVGTLKRSARSTK